MNTYGEALEILHKEDWEGWREWANAQAASAFRDEVVRQDIAREHVSKRLKEIEEMENTTLPGEGLRS